MKKEPKQEQSTKKQKTLKSSKLTQNQQILEWTKNNMLKLNLIIELWQNLYELNML